MIRLVPLDELSANRNLTLTKRERERERERGGERERGRKGERDSMCNSSPAEWTVPECGWRSFGWLIPDQKAAEVECQCAGGYGNFWRKVWCKAV